MALERLGLASANRALGTASQNIHGRAALGERVRAKAAVFKSSVLKKSVLKKSVLKTSVPTDLTILTMLAVVLARP
ncbi:MAG: hypothetical protein AAFY35_07135 [Pseudomonadota bacterium]